MTIESSQMGAVQGEDSSISSPAWNTAGITSSAQVLSGTDCCSFYYGPPSTANERFEAVQIIYELHEFPPSPEVGAALKESIGRARNQMKEGGPYLRHSDIFEG